MRGPLPDWGADPTSVAGGTPEQSSLGGQSTTSWRGGLLRIGGSLLVLGLLVLFLPFDRLLQAFERVPPWAWFLSVPIYLSLHLVGVAKWRMLVNVSGADLAFGEGVRCYYSGLFSNTFLPSVVGGDVVRAGLAMRLGGSRGGVLFGSVLDRLLDVVALASVAAAGAVLAPRALDPRSRRVFLVLLGGLGAVVMGAGLLVVLLPVNRLPFRVRRHLARLRRMCRAIVRQPRYALIALSAGASLQVMLVGLQAFLGGACGVDVPLHVWLFVWPMAKISALVPVTQGGMGVREAALAGLMAPFGVPAVLAVAAGLAFQAVVVSGGLVGGGVAFLLGHGARRRANGVAHPSGTEVS